jgi:hypothetical protein
MFLFLFCAGDGYYDPSQNKILNYDTNEEVRVPDEAEADWIVTKCRVGMI